jgi:sporulation protein YlmC with PRC-barrel domain
MARRFPVGGIACLALTALVACAGGAPPSAAPENGAIPPGVGSQTQLKPDQVRLTRFVGTDVFGRDDRSIGDVADLLVNRTDGKVETAILAVGGFLGFGARHVAVPLDDLKIGANDHLTIDMTQEQLEAAPAFEYGREGSGSLWTGRAASPATGATSP